MPLPSFFAIIFADYDIFQRRLLVSATPIFFATRFDYVIIQSDFHVSSRQ